MAKRMTIAVEAHYSDGQSRGEKYLVDPENELFNKRQFNSLEDLAKEVQSGVELVNYSEEKVSFSEDKSSSLLLRGLTHVELELLVNYASKNPSE